MHTDCIATVSQEPLPSQTADSKHTFTLDLTVTEEEEMALLSVELTLARAGGRAHYQSTCPSTGKSCHLCELQFSSPHIESGLAS